MTGWQHHAPPVLAPSHHNLPPGSPKTEPLQCHPYHQHDRVSQQLWARQTPPMLFCFHFSCFPVWGFHMNSTSILPSVWTSNTTELQTQRHCCLGLCLVSAALEQLPKSPQGKQRHREHGLQLTPGSKMHHVPKLPTMALRGRTLHTNDSATKWALSPTEKIRVFWIST